jgi:hypothetical protein
MPCYEFDHTSETKLDAYVASASIAAFSLLRSAWVKHLAPSEQGGRARNSSTSQENRKRCSLPEE